MINIFILLANLLAVYCMPYRVPLQGLVGGKRTLVVLSDLNDEKNYSQFMQNMKAAGHDLTIIESSDKSFTLKRFGDLKFDNMVLLSTGADDHSSLSAKEILEFVEHGGNVLFGADDHITNSMKSFAEVFGVEYDSKDTSIIDHFHFQANVAGR